MIFNRKYLAQPCCWCCGISLQRCQVHCTNRCDKRGSHWSRYASARAQLSRPEPRHRPAAINLDMGPRRGTDGNWQWHTVPHTHPPVPNLFRFWAWNEPQRFIVYSLRMSSVQLWHVLLYLAASHFLSQKTFNATHDGIKIAVRINTHHAVHSIRIPRDVHGSISNRLYSPQRKTFCSRVRR